MSAWIQTAVYRRTRFLEDQVDQFLARLLQAGLVFRRAIKFNLENDPSRRFEASRGRVSGLEARGEGPPRTLYITDARGR